MYIYIDIYIYMIIYTVYVYQLCIAGLGSKCFSMFIPRKHHLLGAVPRRASPRTCWAQSSNIAVRHLRTTTVLLNRWGT